MQAKNDLKKSRVAPETEKGTSRLFKIVNDFVMNNLFKKTTLILSAYVVITLFGATLNSCNFSDSVEFENVQAKFERELLFSKFKDESSKSAKLIMDSHSRKENLRVLQEDQILQFEERIRPVGLEILYSYGFTFEEIVLEFGSLNSPEISLTAEVIILLEEELNNNKLIYFLDETDLQYASLFGITSSFAQGDTVGGCLADAVGVAAVWEVINGGVQKKMKKEAVKKVIRKVVGRSLGVVGAALAVYDFSDCMGWI